MDLIYTDKNKKELGVLKAYELDVDMANKKDFEIKIGENLLQQGSFVYSDNTELGGRVNRISVNSSTKEYVASGRNFRGILDQKLIEPDYDENTFLANGNVTAIISALLKKCNLEDLFEVEQSALEINGILIPAYTSLHDGIKIILESVNGNFSLRYNQKTRKINITPRRIRDFTEQFSYSKDNTISFKIEEFSGGVNHMICVGEKNEKIIHLFTNNNGGILPYSKKITPIEDADYIIDKSSQMIFGIDEIQSVFKFGSSSVRENYKKMMEPPSDWFLSYEKYYKLEPDGKFVNIKREEDKLYSLLNSQPSDWQRNCTVYFTKTENEYKPVEVEAIGDDYQRLFAKPKNWEGGYKSYYFNDGNYKFVEPQIVNNYVLQTEPPFDWKNNYNKYYFINTNGTYEKATKGATTPIWTKNKFYTLIEIEKAPSFENGVYYNKTTNAKTPIWKPNTYYQITQGKVVPPFIPGNFYQKVTDNYAELVEGGLQRLKELNNKKSQEVSIEEIEAEIGDVVGGTFEEAGIVISEKIKNIIIKIIDDVKIGIEYEIGDDYENNYRI